MEAALDKGTGRHDHIGVIARHGPGLRRHKAVHRCGRLDPLAEARSRPPDVPKVTAWMMSWRLSRAVGNTRQSPAFHRCWRQKPRPLRRRPPPWGPGTGPGIRTGSDAQAGAHLFAQSRERSDGRPHRSMQSFLAHNIAADGSQAAAGIFDQGADDHIRSHICGLHASPQIRRSSCPPCRSRPGLMLLDEGDQLPDPCHGKGGTGGVALGPLDGHQLRPLIDGLPDALIVKAAVGQADPPGGR